MARIASKKWLKAIDELRSISNICNRDLSRQRLVSVFVLLHQMDSAPTLPRTTWESLITTTQVPFKLLEACNQRPGGLASACSCQPASWVYALSFFLRKALDAGVITAAGPPNRTSLIVGQQLERAGLLQQLPAVITAAAQQLADLQDRPEDTAAGLKESSARGMYALVLSSVGWQVFSIQAHLQQLLAVLQQMRCLWPQQELKERVWPAIVLPLMQLLVRLMQHFSLCLDALPDTLQQHANMLIKVLVQAQDAAAHIALPAAHHILSADTLSAAAAAAANHQRQSMRVLQLELAQSPYSSQAVCLLLVMNAYSGMLQRQHAASTMPGSGNNNSSSSSSSSSSSLAATDGRVLSSRVTSAISQARAFSVVQGQISDGWQLACSRHHLLPAVHDELLQALGCSSKAVLVVAAATADWPTAASSRPSALCKLAAASYLHLISCKDSLYDAAKALCRRAHASEQQPQLCLQWSAAEEKLHLLLPSVLLLNAAETPSSAADYVSTCRVAGMCAEKSVEAWRQQSGLRPQPAPTMKQGKTLRRTDESAATTPEDPALLQTQPEQKQVSQQQSRAQTDVEASLAAVDQGLAEAASELQLVAPQVEEAMHLSARYILPQLLLLCQADMPQCETSRSGQQSSGSSGSSSISGAGGSSTAACSSADSSSSSSSSGGGDSSDGKSKRSNSHSTQAKQGSPSRLESPHEAVQDILNYFCQLNDSQVIIAEHNLCTLADKLLLLSYHARRASHTEDKVAKAAAVASVVTSSRDVAAAWLQDAAVLCGSVEWYVRLQAARPSGGSLAQRDCGMALLCSRFWLNTRWVDGGLLQAALAAGPGSPEQTQLFGLLCSLLKFASQLPAAAVPPKQQSQLTPTDAVLSAAMAAASILRGIDVWDYIQQQQQQQQQGPAAAHASSSQQSGQHAYDAAAEGAPQLSSTSAGPLAEPTADAAVAAFDAAGQHTLELLPWLVLFGRCCSMWAEQLLQGAAGPHPDGPRGMFMYFMKFSTIMDVFTRRLCPMTGPGPVLLQGLIAEDDPSAGDAPSGSTVPVLCMESCKAWLSEPSTSAQLEAAGYDVQLLTSKLDAALQAASAVQEPWAGLEALLPRDRPSAAAAVAATAGHVVSAEAVMQLVQQLQALGAAFSTLAISSACNNPTCSNFSGPSEAGLVKGSSSTCGGCRTARYCCRACQMQHWKLHKPVCKALAAARAGSGVS